MYECRLLLDGLDACCVWHLEASVHPYDGSKTFVIIWEEFIFGLKLFRSNKFQNRFLVSLWGLLRPLFGFLSPSSWRWVFGLKINIINIVVGKKNFSILLKYLSVLYIYQYKPTVFMNLDIVWNNTFSFRRQDSQMRATKVVTIGRSDFSHSLKTSNIVLKPGKNEVTLRAKVSLRFY